MHMPNKIVQFRPMSNRWYAMKPLSNDSYTTTNKFQFVETFEENLSSRQQERANKARALYRALGTPSSDDLKAMNRMNLIKNNSVTTEDINLAAMLQQSRAKLLEQTWHQLSVIWWKYQINIWKLIRKLPFLWID